MNHSICENIKQIELEIGNTQLVVVSKYRSILELEKVYECGHRNFGENRVQELLNKYEVMPKDINWHIIGHLQSNKVKYIAPFVHLVHSVDSLKLLQTINKEAIKSNRIISFLFQLHVAQEESKYGIKPIDFIDILDSDEYRSLKNVDCKGIMGMATNTDDQDIIQSEFSLLNALFVQHGQSRKWSILSMGMSGDYVTAVSCGSTMVRVGSKIFNLEE